MSSPALTTTILSASWMVESLWAITIIVMLPLVLRKLSIASYTALSFTLSRAEVASSNNRILGFFKKALAIAILCFYPPDSCPPAWPTFVSIPFSIDSLIKSQALAALSASSISYSVASGLAKYMFSLIEVLKRTGS